MEGLANNCIKNTMECDNLQYQGSDYPFSETDVEFKHCDSIYKMSMEGKTMLKKNERG